jgi:hypothetical protein
VSLEDDAARGHERVATLLAAGYTAFEALKTVYSCDKSTANFGAWGLKVPNYTLARGV